MTQIRIRMNYRSCTSWTFVLCMLLGLGGCGGGGTQSGPPPGPDFSLSVNPTSTSLNPGNSASVSLTANADNGFNSQVSVHISGLPAGVTVPSTSVTLTPGTAQQITFNGAANAPTTNGSVTFTGTSGSLTHTAHLPLTVNGASYGSPGRTRYVRTDATTEYPLYVNQHWTLYHAATARYFV